MILAPVIPVAGNMTDTPAVTVRLIGVLDRVLVESFADACAGLVASGGRTLIVLVRDLTIMRDESLERFLRLLSAYEAAGHRIFVNSTPAWRKVTAARASKFPACTASAGRLTRRQIILCHSVDKRPGRA